MLIYPSIFLFGTFFGLLYSRAKGRLSANTYKTICFLVFFLPVSLQFEVGVDYKAYANIFKYIAAGQIVIIEPGYWALNYITHLLGGNFQVVIAIVAGMTIGLTFSAFPKPQFHLCVAIFFLVFYSWIFTTIRQMLVVSVAYYCYTFFYTNKRYKLTYTLLAAASLFHISSLLYIPIFMILKRVRLNRITVFGFFVFFFTLAPLTVQYLIELLSLLLSGTKYGIYFLMESASTQAPEVNTGLGRALRFIIYIMLFLPIIAYREKKKSSDGMIFMFIVFAFDLMAQHMGIFSRVSRGFIFAYFIIIISIATGSSRLRKVHLMFIFGALTTLFIGGMLNGVNLPYRTVFG